MTDNFLTVNLIAILSPDGQAVLMCKRTTNPYVGLYNFVGGKKETGETDLEGAYREMFEETGIGQSQIQLKHLFTTFYHLDQVALQVFYGTLKADCQLVPEKHPLFWLNVSEHDFSNDKIFAGQGNIKHILDIISVSQQRKGLIDA